MAREKNVAAYVPVTNFDQQNSFNRDIQMRLAQLQSKVNSDYLPLINQVNSRMYDERTGSQTVLFSSTTGTPAYASGGAFGKAVRIRTSASETLKAAKLNTFGDTEGTVEMRIKLDSLSATADQYLFDGGGAANASLEVFLNHSTGKLNLVYGTGSAEITLASTTSPAAATEYHVAFRWKEGSGVALLVNGIVESGCVNNTDPDLTLGTYCYFGCDSAGANQLDGTLEDLRVSIIERKNSAIYDGYLDGQDGTRLPVDYATTLKLSCNDTLASTVLGDNIGKSGATVIIGMEGQSKDIYRADVVIPSGDTSAQKIIAQAIKSLGATGGKIEFLEGTAIIDADIDIAASSTNIHITGQGMATVIQVVDGFTGNIRVFDVGFQCSNIKINNFCIDGNITTPDTKIRGGIYLNTVTNAIISDMCIKNLLTGGTGIAVLQGTSIYIHTNNVIECGTGIRAQQSSQNCNIYNNIVEKCYHAGISGAGGTYLSIANNQVAECGNIVSAGVGISLYNLTNSRCGGNIVPLSVGHGIEVVGGGVVVNDGITVENNIVYASSQGADNTYDNIIVSANCTNVNLRSNICRRGAGAAQPRYGINITASANTGTYDVLNDVRTGGKTGDRNDSGTGTLFIEPVATSTLVTLTGAQELENKTLVTPIMASFYQDAGKTKLMTVPNVASDTLATLAAAQTLTNKTLTLPKINENVELTATSTQLNAAVSAGHAAGSDNQDVFSHIHAYSTGTTDVANSPYTAASETDHLQLRAGSHITLAMDAGGAVEIASDITTPTGDIVGTTDTQTLSNKTLASPKIDDGDAGVTVTSANQTDAAATVTIPDIGDAADAFLMCDTAQTMTNKTMGNDLNFAGHKALAMACDNGTSFPATPSEGQWFYHSGATVNCLFMYVGSAWKPIESFGALTLYVDASSGSDAAGQGYGSGADACATVTYAIGLIPAVFGGNVVVNITGEAYAETVTVQGKYPSGAYTITLQGTDGAAADTGTVSSATVSDASTYYIDDSSKSWTVNAYFGYLVAITAGTGNGQVKLIESNTDTRLRIAGAWSPAPDTTSQYKIYLPGTQITRLITRPGQVAVAANTIDFTHTGSSAVFVDNFSLLSLTNCRSVASSSNAYDTAGGYLAMTNCFGQSAARVLNSAVGGAKTYCYSSIMDGALSSGSYDTVFICHGAFLYYLNGSVISNAKGDGLDCSLNGVAVFHWSSAVGSRCRIYSSGAYGARASTGGQISNCANNYYNANTSGDYTGVAASYGYAG